MKQIFFTLLTLFFLLGCVDKNGFSRFHLSQDEQRWENNRITAPIKHGKKTIGTVTAVYLNKVAPDLYKNGEYFYIALYTKEDVNDTQCSLNALPSLLQEELKDSKEFQKYAHQNAKWDKVYIVGFSPVTQIDVLQLVVKHNEYSSTPLIFKKDE